MLGFMRALTRNKFTGGILLGLVILSMAVWGIEDIFSGNFGSNIYQAGERGVTEQQLNRKFENYLNNVRREQPGNAITRQQATQQGILDQIFTVERSRLTSLGYARELGADASAGALTADVTSIEAFQNPVTKAFDDGYYRSRLQNIGVSPTEFEQDTQDRLTLDYLREGVEATVIPPTDLARVQALFDGEVRAISWFAITKDTLPEPAAPSEEELQAFYQERADIFQAPERRRLTMLQLSADSFIDEDSVTEEDITALYEATKSTRLATPDQRTFIQAIYPTEDAAAQAFGVLAVGGELEASPEATISTRTAIADEVALQEFRDNLFAPNAAPGTVAGPFETPNGWIVGSLTAVTPGEPKPLEEVRPELIAEIAADNAEIAYYTALNEFDDLIGQGLRVSEIAERFGTDVTSFDPVDARGLTSEGEFIQELTVSPDAFQQAFALQEGDITDRYDEDAGTILISIDEIIAQNLPPLEDNRERALEAFKLSRENDALQSAADAAKANIETGESTMSEEATRFEANLETSDGLRRTAFDRTLPQSVLRAAFTLDEGKTSVVQGRAPTERIIVKLETIVRPATSELDILAPISAPKIREQINQDILFAFEQEVQEAVKINTNVAAFNAYKTRLLEDQ